VEEKINAILMNYLEKPVIVSNGFKKEEYKSVLSMVEEKFTSLYDNKFLQTGSCNGQDPILKKLEEKINYQVDSLIRNFNSKIETEAKKIADKAIKESSLYEALQKAGIVKN